MLVPKTAAIKNLSHRFERCECNIICRRWQICAINHRVCCW